MTVSEVGESRCLGPHVTISSSLAPDMWLSPSVVHRRMQGLRCHSGHIPLSPSQGNPFIEYGLDLLAAA